MSSLKDLIGIILAKRREKGTQCWVEGKAGMKDLEN